MIERDKAILLDVRAYSRQIVRGKGEIFKGCIVEKGCELALTGYVSRILEMT